MKKFGLYKDKHNDMIIMGHYEGQWLKGCVIGIGKKGKRLERYTIGNFATYCGNYEELDQKSITLKSSNHLYTDGKRILLINFDRGLNYGMRYYTVIGKDIIDLHYSGDITLRGERLWLHEINGKSEFGHGIQWKSTEFTQINEVKLILNEFKNIQI